MRRLITLVALFAVGGTLGVLHAAPAIDADPNKEYRLSPSEGPFMIYVASYHGDEAYDNARHLVHVLRSEHKLPAYLYSKSEQERAERDQLLEQIRKETGGAPLKKYRVVEEWAVLIGNYKSLDAAHSDLASIKKKPLPKTLPTSLVTRSERIPKSAIAYEQKTVAAAKYDPWAGAFAVRNPLAPKEKVAAQPKNATTDDAAWLQLNESEKHSLLKCAKPWTLIVRVSRPSSITSSKPSIFDSFRPWSSDKKPKAADSTTDANRLAELLRSSAYGYEAYVLHTRDSSFVTVGGFTSPNDPELVRTQRQLAGLKVEERVANGVMTYKLLDAPIPMQVPKP